MAKEKYIKNMEDIVQDLVEAGAHHIFYIDYTASGRVSGFYYIAYMPEEVRNDGGINEFLLGVPPQCVDYDGEERLDCSDDVITPLYKQVSDETWEAISAVSSVVKRAPVGGFIREIEDNMAFYGFQPDLYGFCYGPNSVLPCLKEELYGYSEPIPGEGGGDPTQFVFEDNVHWGPRTYRIFAIIMQDVIRQSLNAKYGNKGKGREKSEPFNFKRAYVKGRL